jgi:hypothetical protein
MLAGGESAPIPGSLRFHAGVTLRYHFSANAADAATMP